MDPADKGQGCSRCRTAHEPTGEDSQREQTESQVVWPPSGQEQV